MHPEQEIFKNFQSGRLSSTYIRKNSTNTLATSKKSSQNLKARIPPPLPVVFGNSRIRVPIYELA